MSKYSNEPQFAETAALIAVMNDDEEELDRLLDGLLDGELMSLYRHAEALRDQCGHVARKRLAEKGES